MASGSVRTDPDRQVAWIDAVVVLRGLPKLFPHRRGPFITPENLAPEQTANPWRC